jgi:lactose/L-arabinose transport system permease protein
MIALATRHGGAAELAAAQGAALYRFAFFAPVVVGEVAYAAVFRLMFNLDFGIINKLLNSVGMPKFVVRQATPAMALIIIAVTWRWAGYNAIIMLAGLQSIPEDVYEAATLDRVSKAQQFIPHHAAAPEADHPFLRHPVDHRHHAALHRAVPDHQSRRSRRRHRNTRPAPLSAGLYLAQFRLRLGHRLHDGRAGDPDLAAQSLGREGTEMNPNHRSLLVRSIALHAGLTPLAIIWLFPLWMMFVFSTMPDYGIFSPKIVLLPSTNFLENFNNLQADTDFVRAMIISVVVAVVYTFLSVLLTSMAGWALARYRFVGKLDGHRHHPRHDHPAVCGRRDPAIHHGGARVQAGQHLGCPDRAAAFQFARRAVHAAGLFDDAGELFDAARVEGVKEWQIFLRIALPLARPTMAALAIILFLASWNNYLWPLLINSKPGMMTAPVALGTLIGLTKVSWGGIMAGAMSCSRRRSSSSSYSCSVTSSPASPPAPSNSRETPAWQNFHSKMSSSASAPRDHPWRQPRGRDGEFVVFVGPSGCGKSTLLRMIAGLEDITGGEINIGGKVVNDVEPADRGIAMVFQSYALYPHMTVEQNLSFGLRMNGNPKADTEKRVQHVANILQINELMQAPPEAAVGRPAPARCHRPRHRARAAGFPVR